MKSTGSMAQSRLVNPLIEIESWISLGASTVADITRDKECSVGEVTPDSKL